MKIEYVKCLSAVRLSDAERKSAEVAAVRAYVNLVYEASEHGVERTFATYCKRIEFVGDSLLANFIFENHILSFVLTDKEVMVRISQKIATVDFIFNLENAHVTTELRKIFDSCQIPTYSKQEQLAL